MPFDPNDEPLDLFTSDPVKNDTPSDAVPYESAPDFDQPDTDMISEQVRDLFAEAAADNDTLSPAAPSENESQPEQWILAVSVPTSEAPTTSDDALQNADDIPAQKSDEDFSYTPPDLTDTASAAPESIPESPSESARPKEESSKSADKKSPKKVAVRKGRPRRTNGEGLLGIPNIIVTGVWCALILLIGLTLGRMLWLCAAEVLAFGKNDVTVTVTITENDTIDDIATKLAREGLIQYRELFKLYARFAVDDGDIKPGVWELNTKYDYHALVNGMAPSSTRSVVKVTIPEGYSCRQIFELLAEKKVCSVADLCSYSSSGELGNYWFLENVTRGDMYCLEGFLFPDTYEFYTNDTPRNVLSKMLNNFNSKFDESMIWKINQLNETLTSMMRRNGKSEAFISEHQFTVREVVIVASLIEKETSSSEEGYMIASVIYNRLFNWGSTPAYLNIDATIVYATGGNNEDIAANLRIDSPYNTYLYTGLTPGPISNPGVASLKAALEPNNSNYYYYVLDPSVNHHIFATTQAEHDANVASVNQRK